VSDATPYLPIEELIEKGLYDPQAPGAEYRLRVIGRVLRRGGTLDDIAENAHELESLASRLQLRPTAKRYTLAELAERAGLDPDQARRLNRAGGFPDPEPDARIFDDEDVEIFVAFQTASSLFGEELLLQLSRVMGWAMSRVADAMLSIFASYAGEQSQTREIDEQAMAEANASAVALIPGAVRVMDVMLRRHIEARARTDAEFALGDEWQGLDMLDRGIGFCDLVGYTELGEKLTTIELADVLERFEGRAADVVVSGGGSVVKQIGDEVMFVAPDAASVEAIALDLVRAFGGDELPPVRVGVSSGRVILREADYFGSVVNIAARIVKLAPPGGVLAPASFRDLATQDVGYHDAGRPALKGFDEPVELVALRR
jgi:adenylate cyclase